jgi:DNA-binding protein H-NS
VSESLENLESMNEGELRELIQRAQAMLRERGTKQLDELRQLAREAGYEVTLIKIGVSKGSGRRGAAGKRGHGDRQREVSAKYQHPDNPNDKWSGRGRQPKWVQMALAHGWKLEDLAGRDTLSAD